MSAGIILLLLIIISWIINHLGAKPVSGGSPPSDNIVIRIRSVITGSLFHEWDRVVVVVAEVMMSNINVVIVIGM